MEDSEIVAVTTTRSLVTLVTAQRSLITAVTAIRKPTPSIELAMNTQTIGAGATVTKLDRPMTFDATLDIPAGQTVEVAGTLIITGR